VRGARVIGLEGPELVVSWAGEVARVPGARAAAAVQVGDLVAPAPVGDRWEIVSRPLSAEPIAPGTDAFRFLFQDPARWARLRARAAVLAKTRAWFDAAGFLAVETPLVVASPGTEVHLDAVEAQLRPRPGAPPEPRFLITSPEYHMKRLLAAGGPPIYQVCKVFRDGEEGSRHRPEFTMIEWYRPFQDLDAIANDCEAWLADLLGRSQLGWGGKAIDLARPWPRIAFLDALRGCGITDPERLTPEEQLRAFGERVDPWLADAPTPILVVDWPIRLASLARPKPGDPSVAERFELYIAGLELGNAFGELCDPVEQRRRCEADQAARRAAGKPAYPLDLEFLAALEAGMPPSSGIAVGLDRVVMLCTGATRIDEVLAF
jgi:lysyl-tRNA synthetase class 2